MSGPSSVHPTAGPARVRRAPTLPPIVPMVYVTDPPDATSALLERRIVLLSGAARRRTGQPLLGRAPPARRGLPTSRSP